MDPFSYKKDELYIDKCPLSRIAREVGTPVYVYSKKALIENFLEFKRAFQEFDPIICFSIKANSNLAVLSILHGLGCGFDVVSSGEIYRAKKVKADFGKVVYASVGKTRQDIEYALKNGILMFNVESEAELRTIDEVAGRMKKPAHVALRINPDVDAKTHKYITTGKKENKFGIDLDTAARIIKNRAKFKSVDMAGLHLHLGSQVCDTAHFAKGLKKALAFYKKISKDTGWVIRYLNIGGGLGVAYNDEKPDTPKDYCANVAPVIREFGDVRLILEPGRYICSNIGAFLVSCIYVKETPAKKFAIVDGAMNDLIRPSLYDAYHKIVPIRKRKGKTEIYDVVGPVCESGDFFAKGREIQAVKDGDLLAVLNAGAYGFVMSSNYNSRPRPPEVIVEGSGYFVARRRETFADLVRLERWNA